MLRLLALLILSTVYAAGEIVSFPTYGCQIEMPDSAAWQRQIPREIPAGEVIFHAVQQETESAFLICYLPNVPSVDLRTEGVTALILRALTSFGFQSTPPKLVNNTKVDFLQFIAGVPGQEDVVCVARAALRNRAVYLLMMIGKGGPERAEDKNFNRISESFRFIDQEVPLVPLASNPLYGTYKIGAIACAGTAVALLIVLACVMFATRRQYR